MISPSKKEKSSSDVSSRSKLRYAGEISVDEVRGVWNERENAPPSRAFTHASHVESVLQSTLMISGNKTDISLSEYLVWGL